MALQLSTEKFGATFAQAYYKAERIVVSKDGIHISVNVYNTANGEVMDSKHYQMDYDAAGGEPLTQAYNYLKTLPEYSGATDV